MDLPRIGTYLWIVSACNSEPTLVIMSAGRNNLTHVLEMSLEDDSFKRLNLDATAP
jgi:hypothetical protein